MSYHQVQKKQPWLALQEIIVMEARSLVSRVDNNLVNISVIYHISAFHNNNFIRLEYILSNVYLLSHIVLQSEMYACYNTRYFLSNFPGKPHELRVEMQVWWCHMCMEKRKRNILKTSCKSSLQTY